MLKIGITGGIGSGKTTVCKIFEQLNVPVFYADTESKKLLNTPQIQKQLVSVFGNEIMDNNNSINRTILAKLVFENKMLLEKLNGILHPAVATRFNEWLKLHSKNKYILKEAAILFESGAYKQLDKIITIEAPVDIRIKRVMLRDNEKKENIISRINNQLNDEERKKLSDFVITNDEKKAVLPQVLSIHEKIVSGNE